MNSKELTPEQKFHQAVRRPVPLVHRQDSGINPVPEHQVLDARNDAVEHEENLEPGEVPPAGVRVIPKACSKCGQYHQANEKNVYGMNEHQPTGIMGAHRRYMGQLSGITSYDHVPQA